MAASRASHRDIVPGWHPFTPEEIKRYVSKGFWHNLTVGQLLDRNSLNYPQKLAVVDDSAEVTWSALRTRCDRLAVHLKKLGVGSGDFFFLQMPNIVEFFYLYFALNRIGAIPIMGLPRHRRMVVDEEIRLHEAKGVCVALGEKFDYMQMIEEIRQNHPYMKLLFCTKGNPPKEWIAIDELLQEGIEGDYVPDYLDQFQPGPDDISTEQLSGGTTGVPKGIPRTHNDYICQWDHYGRAAGFTDESVALVPIPVAHNASLQCLCGPVIFRGGTIVLTESRAAEAQFQLIEKYKITHTLLIPVQITYWVEAESSVRKFNLQSLKIVSSGAQKVRPDLVDWCLEKLKVNFVNIFGMAEGPIICTRWDSPTEVQEHTVGKPIIIDEDIGLRLVDWDNREVPRGQVGEMVMKGPITFKGYLRDEAENAKAFDPQGFMHSGDLMSIREDGNYVVEGRKKYMILRGGENVYPERIEDQIMKHPKVSNCCVIGVPDARLGEKVCAFVQPKAGQQIGFAELTTHLKGVGMAVFELPEIVEIADSLPLTAVNKIDKKGLRAYMTVALFKNGRIDRSLGDEFLKNEGLTIEDVESGSYNITFSSRTAVK